MAGVESIEVAGYALEDSVAELVTLLKAFHELADGVADAVGASGMSAGWPSWLFAMEARVHVIDERAQAYVLAVNRGALPILRDVQRASAEMHR
jgi:hypothetical protein